jgi:hypothetical protein
MFGHNSILPTDGATLTYSVARDGYGDVTLWVETSDPYDSRFCFGPLPVLAKRSVDLAVWDAACRVLVGRK